MCLKIHPLIFVFTFGLPHLIDAQCNPGEVHVTVDVLTDDYGYECFWDLTTEGDNCGVNSEGSYGNTTEMDCSSGGLQAATSGNGYPDNSVITENLGCLLVDDCFNINYVDDFGEGGAAFKVYMDGIQFYSFTGSGFGNVFTFCVQAPHQYDAVINAVPFEYTQLPLVQSTNILNSATVQARCIEDLSNVVVTASVVRDEVVVHSETSQPVNILSGQNNTFNFTGYTPTTIGSYNVVYAVYMNEMDQNMDNNMDSCMVEVADTVYARDNGTMDDYIGIGNGNVGYFGNIFHLNEYTSVTSVSAFVDNTDASWDGQTLYFEVFGINSQGIPANSVGVASTVVTDEQQWNTATFSNPLDLPAGDYLFAVKEEATLQQQIGWCDSVFTPGKSWVSWTTNPWKTAEELGFDITFMIRPNVKNNVKLEEKYMQDLILYPNPAQKEIVLTSLDPGARIEIVNILGQMMHESTAQKLNQPIAVDDWQKGMYFVKITSKEHVYTGQFVKE